MSKQARSSVFAIVSIAIVIVLFWEPIVAAQKVYNDWWGAWLESGIWFVAIPSMLLTAFYWRMPRYTAIVFHDSQSRWLDVETQWSKTRGKAVGDTALWAKAKSGEVITGRFVVNGKDCIIAENPVHRYVKTIWFGAERGVYYVVAVEVLNKDFLKQTKRCATPPVQHEELMTPPAFSMKEMPKVESETEYDPDFTPARPPRRPSESELVIKWLEENCPSVMEEAIVRALEADSSRNKTEDDKK